MALRTRELIEAITDSDVGTSKSKWVFKIINMGLRTTTCTQFRSEHRFLMLGIRFNRGMQKHYWLILLWRLLNMTLKTVEEMHDNINVLESKFAGLPVLISMIEEQMNAAMLISSLEEHRQYAATVASGDATSKDATTGNHLIMIILAESK